MAEDDTRDAELADARASVLAAVRRLLRQGGLSLRPATLFAHRPLFRLDPALTAKLDAGLRLGVVERDTWHDSRDWQSTQQWLGPLSQSDQRALVFVAVEVVERITGDVGWASEYLDEHRIRLDLRTELHEIDEQAYRLAELHHRIGGPDETHGPVLAQGWAALVDRVAALSMYADLLAALESERPAAVDVALADDSATALIAGSARDELATDHVRALADDLRQRDGTGITNSSTSHRNAT